MNYKTIVLLSSMLLSGYASASSGESSDGSPVMRPAAASKTPMDGDLTLNPDGRTQLQRPVASTSQQAGRRLTVHPNQTSTDVAKECCGCCTGCVLGILYNMYCRS